MDEVDNVAVLASLVPVTLIRHYIAITQKAQIKKQLMHKHFSSSEAHEDVGIEIKPHREVSSLYLLSITCLHYS